MNFKSIIRILVPSLVAAVVSYFVTKQLDNYYPEENKNPGNDAGTGPEEE